MSVDLPAPLGPNKPTTCPAGISKVTSFSTRCEPKDLLICWQFVIIDDLTIYD